MALTGQIPDLESERRFYADVMALIRAADDAVFVGHSKIEELDFPSSIEYTPSGYRVID